VEKELDNHHQLAQNVNNYLDKIKKIQDATRHDDSMPGSLSEQLSEANSLLTSLPRELEVSIGCTRTRASSGRDRC
jgi:regulator of PEP synthase PpsR (kinase-PPPase family)